jgi:ubiquinone/menaquinone biosynthesis C-methylase UbiE
MGGVLSNAAFEDNFSKQADAYARYRPQYPAALYEWIASIAPGHDRVWDCGTGSGQAAIGLTQYFDHVIATDPSANQIANATRHPQIEYRVAPAEESGLGDQSVDAVTVALALHWFDLDRFYPEVKRVLKPGGVIAAWCYYLPQIAPEIDQVVADYDGVVLRDYWSPRIQPLRKHYRTLPFPFHELTAPEFAIEMRWTLADLIGYLHSWSGAQAYQDAHGTNPLEFIQRDLSAAWDDADQREVRWPLFVRAGRFNENVAPDG